MSDYYSLLQVGRYATVAEIRAAFRRRAKETHPDTRADMGDDKSQFLEVKHAYDVLSDSDSRHAYDESFRSNSLAVAGFPQEDEQFAWQPKRNEYQRPPPPPKPSRAKKAPPAPREEILADDSKPSPEGDYQYTCHVTLEEAYEGARIRFSVRSECGTCEGRGFQPVAGPECDACNGSGHAFKRSLLVRMIFGDPCAACNGKGYALTPIDCSDCGGSGKFGEAEEYWTDMRAGIEDGAIISGPNENLRAKIWVWPHRTFQRAGDDLMLTIYLKEASLTTGIVTTIRNIKGIRKKWPIPAGSEQGLVFRMPGWGMPRLRGFSYGDLIVSVKPLEARPPDPKHAEQ